MCSRKENNMKVKTLEMLYVQSLRDAYSAETQLIAALPKTAEKASSADLKKLLLDHLEETKEHKKSVAKICKELGEEAGGHECVAMQGLIKETEEVMEEVTDPFVRDAAIIGMCQKVEHYEIAGYGTARTFAQLLGHGDQATMLDEILQQEADADESLSDLAEASVNEKAMTGKDSKSKTEAKTALETAKR